MKARNRALAAVAAAALAVTAIAACAYTPTGNSGGSTSNAQASKPDYFGCNTGDAFLCTSGPAAVGGGAAAGGGVPTADAGPIPQKTAEGTGGTDCSFYYFPDSSGLQVHEHVQIVGSLSVACRPLPRSLSVSITIYRLPPLSADLVKNYIAVGFGAASFPGTVLTEPTDAFAPCDAGLHYLEMYAVGVSSTGKKFTAHVLGDTVEVNKGPANSGAACLG